MGAEWNRQASARVYTPHPENEGDTELGSVMLYDPTAPAPETATGNSARGGEGLAGKVVGFIDNAKPNFNYLVDDLAEALIARHGVAAVVKRRKTSASVPAPQDIVAELAERCDVVITGSGD
jgi:hypothetical protein